MTPPTRLRRLLPWAAGVTLGLGMAASALGAPITHDTTTAAPATRSTPAAAPITRDTPAPTTRAPTTPLSYVPHEVIVGLSTTTPARLGDDIAARADALAVRRAASAGMEVLRLPVSANMPAVAAALRRMPDVRYAVPDYIAHLASGWVPDDPGLGTRAGQWQSLQWNFLPAAGVDAPDAWAHLRADRAPGGQGTVIAVLDTGVAYRNWVSPFTHRVFRASPDFAGTRFVAPCDLVLGSIAHLSRGQIVRSSTCTDTGALDREGHGTFVAGVIGEATDNRLGVTGLAYGASIMPVRILDAEGNGDSLTIAQGILWAVAHGAQVINLSLEFDPSVQAADIPDVMDAIAVAHRRGVVVVAAAGNDGASVISYPARDPAVISVGATTIDECRADYSNAGLGLDLVAPGGGDDATLSSDPDCRPGRVLPDITQMTLLDASQPTRFGLPGGWYGTSMAAPHVSATAALLIASGVLGRHPTPDAILARLRATARPLGTGRPNPDYGYGLLDAAAATAGTP